MITEKDLFRTTESSSVIYEPVWAMAFYYQGDETEVAWCKVSSTTNNFIDYSMRVIVNGEIASEFENRLAVEMACSLRGKEVLKELLLQRNAGRLGEGSFYALEDIADAIETLYARASTGEFVGQQRGAMIYVQEAASILNVSPRKALDAVETILLPHKRIGLNGMILTSWESQEADRRMLEERTGHKNLSLSDFGGWYCAACGKHGDEYDESPSKYECV